MAKRITFSYDKKGDLLDISLGKAKKAISTEVEDDFFIRKDIKSGEVIGFSILNFEKWFQGEKDVREVPLSGSFHLVRK